MVYLGSSHPIAMDPPGAADGAVVLAATPVRPSALAQLPHIGVVASWYGGNVSCSCVFLEQSVPWEPRPESPETLGAFARLRQEVERHIALGLSPIVFAAWVGHEDEPPVLCWRLAPRHLVPGHQLFKGGHLIEGGIPPDTYLLEFAPDVEAPEHRVQHVP
ncbi:MAG: hypothetical protein OEM24_14115 [Paracoccaceae bacterium]|nr:hypothetical protein [Paracoccaceae bacterium]